VTEKETVKHPRLGRHRRDRRRRAAGSPSAARRSSSRRWRDALIGSGSTFERDHRLLAPPVVDDEWVFVSGTTGFDYATMTLGRRRRRGRPSNA